MPDHIQNAEGAIKLSRQYLRAMRINLARSPFMIQEIEALEALLNLIEKRIDDERSAGNDGRDPGP